MASITSEDAIAAYEIARCVVAGEISERQGIAKLVEDRGMNAASAGDYIRNLRQMLAGKVSHRTLNTFSVQYYLGSILADYGSAAAERALRSVRDHIQYYNALGRGRLNSVEAVCDAFAVKLEGVAERAFSVAVAASMKLQPTQRASRLALAKRLPDITTSTILVYRRNPDVVAEVLLRAAGICEGCHRPAPFARKSDGTPYLEVHHVVPLAAGGEDVVNNALGLCPNCHRERHYG